MSGSIRRLIGTHKRTLSRSLHNCDQVFADYNLSSERPNFLSLDDESFLDFASDATDARDKLVASYTQLTHLNDRWTELKAQNSEENDIYANYIAKYGDYHSLLQQTVAKINTLDDVLNQTDQECARRNLELPPHLKSLDSSQDSPSEHDEAFWKTPLEVIRQNLSTPSVFPSTQIRTSDTPQPLEFSTQQVSHTPDTRPVFNNFAGPPAPSTQPNVHFSRPPAPTGPSRNRALTQPLHYGPPMFNFVDASILSKMELPSFSGNLLEWPEFWSRFSSLIGDKPDVDPSTKFTVLRSCLRNEALLSIDGLSANDRDYFIAVDILKSHYDDKTTIRHIIFTKLISLPDCDSEGRQLSSLYNRMFSLIRQYIALGDDTPEYGLSAALLNKLPKYVKSRIYDKCHSHNLTPKELLDLLTDIVRKERTLLEMESPAIRHTGSNSSNSQTFHASTGKVRRPRPNENFSSRNQHDGSPSQRFSTYKCQLCHSDQHRVFNCTTYTDGHQRSNAARSKNLCMNCLRDNHKTSECPSRNTCKNCSRKHHTSLCYARRSDSSVQQHHQHPRFDNSRDTRNAGSNHNRARAQIDRTQPSPRPPPKQKRSNVRDQSHFVQSDNDESSTATATVPLESTLETIQQVHHTDDTSAKPYIPEHPNSSTDSGHVLLMCAPVTLFNPDNPDVQVTTTAFLDSGSTKSYITTELASALHLPFHHKEDLHIHTFGSTTSNTFEASLHKLGLHTIDGSQKILHVKSLQTLTNSMQILHLDETSGQGTTITAQPGLLVGNDYFWELILSDNFHYKSLPNGYRIIHTKLGDIVTGKNFKPDHSYSIIESSSQLTNPVRHHSLESLVEKFWKFETIGIIDNPCQNDNDQCLKLFNESIIFDPIEMRYSVSLPFKVDPINLPSNYSLAYSRLLSNVRMLKKNTSYMEKYNDIFIDQLRRGIIETVDVRPDDSKCHFLAHHGVVKDDRKTTKIRCVYDGSAKLNGKLSINDALFPGPILLPQIPGILLRSRLTPILISSDLEKAFLMVGLNDESRNYTCFLWLKDIHLGCTPDNIIIYRFKRVPFGLNVSPFLLAGTIHFHLESTGTPLAQSILRNTYVDNLFLPATSVQEGKELYKESRKLFAAAGMNLREFASNDDTLNEFFTNETGEHIDPTAKVLGITWQLKQDSYSIRLPSPVDDSAWTKRKVLKYIASTFDPLGWIAPAILPGKLFLQSLWKLELAWDEVLPDSLAQTWSQILSTWIIPVLSLNRNMLAESADNKFSLHVFTDASKAAYGACAYLVQTQKDNVCSHLLMAKTRLSPNSHTVTIPRLELSALTIGARLIHYLKKELYLPISDSYLWSDSKVALMWTKNEKDLPVFVRNRVRTIQEYASQTTLRHVPGEFNPADLASRGTNITDLLDNKLWWHGPAFLTDSSDSWPVDKSESEFEPPPREESHTTATAVEKDEEPAQQSLIDVQNFSSWNRLLHTAMFVLLFCRLLLKTGRNLHELKALARQDAEILLFRIAQTENKPSPKVHQQLQLYKCSTTKLLRSKGRLQHSSLPMDTTNPVFLPKNHRITDLFVLYTHQTSHHCGVAQTITEIRTRVWIPQIRSVVKRVLNNLCFYCKRYKAKPYALPDFPPLPAVRVNQPNYPFENTGMDYLGPMFYRHLDSSTRKYWIVLLTCLNSRAISCEIVTDMTSLTLLHMLRRFIATNGYPRFILCDNAKVFQSISALQSSMESRSNSDCDVVDYCSPKGIHFKFIPSYSPWQGGCYERLVGIFKKCFKHAIGNRILHMEDLKTLLKESEAICNSRPLTYVSDQTDNFPLRPIDFLRPHALLSSPRFLDNCNDTWKPVESNKDNLLNDWKHTTYLLDKFWKRWQSEYLTTLRELYKISHPHPRSFNVDHPQKGEIVILHDDILDRGQWKLGEVVDSQDTFLRSAQVRLPSGRIITRPINLLYKLEIESHTTATTNPNQNADTDSNTSTSHHEPTGNNAKSVQPVNRHMMITRGKIAANVLSVLTLLHIFSFATSSNTKCPEELTTKKRIIYTTSCSPTGAAIAIYSMNDTSDLCWFPIVCPHGEIKNIVKEMEKTSIFNTSTSSTTQVLCGKKCECPSWTTTCSHYDGKRQTSTPMPLPSSITSYRPPQVCSLVPNASCDPIKRIGIFNKIEMYDGSQYLVPNLQVNLKEFLDSEDFQCFNKQGDSVPAEPPYTGTSFFCAKQACKDNYDKFCIYGNPIATFDSPEVNETIIIKAWGTTSLEYFGFVEKPKVQYHIESGCAKGGIVLSGPPIIDKVKACIQSYCVLQANYPENSDINFPNSVTIFNYHVEIQAWMDNLLTYNSSIHCKSSPFCETLRCTFCKEKLYNYDCWTLSDMSLYGIISFTSMLLLCLARIVHSIFLAIQCGLSWITFLLSRLFHYLIYYICCLFRKRQRPHINTTYPAYRDRYKWSRRRHMGKLAVSILVNLWITNVDCCSEVVSMTASAEECVVDAKNQSMCTMNQATTLTLQPINQETCLTLRDSKNEPFGFLSIRVKGIEHVCIQKTEFFTRDHQFVTESSHRCASSGSCTSDRCGEITTDDKLDEFSNTANQSPGYTSCEDSCGCLTCDNCFLCSSSCQFQRLYAAPTTSHIYRVFTCTSWDLSVSLDVSLINTKDDHGTSLRLHPGKAVRWNDMQFTLISTTSPVQPILSSTFLTDGTATSIIKQASAGILLPHSPSQLQCKTRNDAKQFTCSFPQQVCNCHIASYKSVCNCADGKIAKYLKMNTLPLTTKNILIYPDGQSIKAQANSGSSLQVQLVANNLKLKSVRHNVTCDVKSSDLTGCYSCFAGAEVQVGCTSKQEVTADMTCGTQQSVLLCTHQGHMNKVVFSFDAPNIDLNCTIRCPGGTVHTTVKGKLRFVSDVMLPQSGKGFNQNRVPDSSSTNVLDLVKNFFSMFSFKFFLYTFIIFSIIALIIYFGIKLYCKVDPTARLLFSTQKIVKKHH